MVAVGKRRVKRNGEVNEAEEIFESAAIIAKKDGEIVGYIHCDRNGRDDIAGVDFFLILGKDLFLPIQVKTYVNKTHNEQKLREHLQRHPDVTSVIFIDTTAKTEKESEKVIAEVRREIRVFIKAFKSRFA